MKSQALNLVKVATSVNMLGDSAAAIKQIAMLIRMRQEGEAAAEPEQVGDFGQVGVENEATVQVLELLNGLKVTTIGNLRMLEAQEEDDITAFDAAQTKFTEDLAANAEEIERLSGVVAENQACVEETSEFIFVLGGENGRIEKQSHILGKATQMCQTFADEYERTTDLRTQQAGLLEALRDALSAKLDSIYGSARTRANQEEEEWDNLGVSF
jgi:hypothetical protein